MTREEILDKSTWNKNTIYQDQLTFKGPDGKGITVVRSKEGMSRSEVIEILIDEVQARYA